MVYNKNRISPNDDSDLMNRLGGKKSKKNKKQDREQDFRATSRPASKTRASTTGFQAEPREPQQTNLKQAGEQSKQSKMFGQPQPVNKVKQPQDGQEMKAYIQQPQTQQKQQKQQTQKNPWDGLMDQLGSQQTQQKSKPEATEYDFGTAIDKAFGQGDDSAYKQLEQTYRNKPDKFEKYKNMNTMNLSNELGYQTGLGMRDFLEDMRRSEAQNRAQSREQAKDTREKRSREREDKQNQQKKQAEQQEKIKKQQEIQKRIQEDFGTVDDMITALNQGSGFEQRKASRVLDDLVSSGAMTPQEVGEMKTESRYRQANQGVKDRAQKKQNRQDRTEKNVKKQQEYEDLQEQKEQELKDRKEQFRQEQEQAENRETVEKKQKIQQQIDEEFGGSLNNVITALQQGDDITQRKANGIIRGLRDTGELTATEVGDMINASKTRLSDKKAQERFDKKKNQQTRQEENAKRLQEREELEEDRDEALRKQEEQFSQEQDLAERQRKAEKTQELEQTIKEKFGNVNNLIVRLYSPDTRQSREAERVLDELVKTGALSYEDKAKMTNEGQRRLTQQKALDRYKDKIEQEIEQSKNWKKNREMFRRKEERDKELRKIDEQQSQAQKKAEQERKAQKALDLEKEINEDFGGADKLITALYQGSESEQRRASEIIDELARTGAISQQEQAAMTNQGKFRLSRQNAINRFANKIQQQARQNKNYARNKQLEAEQEQMDQKVSEAEKASRQARKQAEQQKKQQKAQELQQEIKDKFGDMNGLVNSLNQGTDLEQENATRILDELVRTGALGVQEAARLINESKARRAQQNNRDRVKTDVDQQRRQNENFARNKKIEAEKQQMEEQARQQEQASQQAMQQAERQQKMQAAKKSLEPFGGSLKKAILVSAFGNDEQALAANKAIDEIQNSFGGQEQIANAKRQAQQLAQRRQQAIDQRRQQQQDAYRQAYAQRVQQARAARQAAQMRRQQQQAAYRQAYARRQQQMQAARQAAQQRQQRQMQSRNVRPTQTRADAYRELISRLAGAIRG